MVSTLCRLSAKFGMEVLNQCEIPIDGRIAVEVAALDKDWELLDVLLNEGADINGTDRGKSSYTRSSTLRRL